MKIIFSPGAALEQFAAHDAVEVGIVMNFVLYGAGRPLTEREMEVATDRIVGDLTALGISPADAYSAVYDAIAKFGDVDEYKRTSFMPEVFKACA